MEGILIGALLVVAGIFCCTYVRKSFQNKNLEIQYIKTSTIAETRKNLEENEKAGFTGYREYVELKGKADAKTPQSTPYSKQEVAYYDANMYQVYEETNTYRDEKGNVRNRITKSESLISNQKSMGPLLVKDPQTGERAIIEISEAGMQLDTIKAFDKFEPQQAMQQYGFFKSLSFRPLGARTLGFRMTEEVIPIGHSLYVLGEAYLQSGELYIGKPLDGKKPFIVSVKSEAELIESNKFASTLSLVGGIVLAVLGVFVMIFY
mgnify:CR=1 FL=1